MSAVDEVAPGGAMPWEDEIRLLPGAFKPTDMGNAERLVARYRGDLRYCPAREKWLVWNGREWEWDETMRVQAMAKATVRGILAEAHASTDPDERKNLAKWAAKSEGRDKSTSLVSMARSETGIPVRVTELDLDPWLLNCSNGTLDLRTGELREARREDLITKTTGVAYREGASSLLWERTLYNATGGDGDLAGYLQRVAGYALTGIASERAFFFLYGPPGTGKSTLIDALQSCMGTYARSTSFETWIKRPNVGGNRDDLVSLQGVRLVTSGEVAPGAQWDVALVKQITGGDRISASAKFETVIEFNAACTIMLAANDCPTAREEDAGFWERMQRVPLSHVVPVAERVKELRAQLREPEHAEAILRWAVEGCAMWRDEGVGTCPAVQVSTEEYRKDNDWIGSFIEQNLTLNPRATVPAKIFRGVYKNWCEDEGVKPMAAKSLSKKLESHGVRLRTVNGRQEWVGADLRRGQDETAETFAFGAVEA